MFTLTDEEWNFVEQHRNDDTNRLRLSAHGNLAMTRVIDQIECRRRAEKKLATTLNKAPRFIFPSVLSAEQSTSDSLAEFHASLMPDDCRVLDMTCGLGIDTFHIAEKSDSVDSCEINELTASAAEHNAGLLGLKNVNVHCTDSTEFLKTLPPDSFGCIFIDPARRGDHGKRLFALSDCSPDVTSLLPKMLTVAPQVVIKASPMIDVTHTATALGSNVQRIIAVGDRRECKELIIVCGRQKEDNPMLEAVTLNDGKTISHWSHTKPQEDQASADYGIPGCGDFLYEPSPAAMKIAPLKLLSARLGVKKIAPNSHLYHSPGKILDFPGRCYRIMDVTGFSKSDIKTLSATYDRLDISVRNFPMKPDEISKKLRIKTGGNHHLFATRSENGHPLLIVGELQ